MTKRLMRTGPGLQTKGLGPAISKFSDAARRIVTSKTPVKRLQVKDPSRALTDESIAKTLTNNPNLKYQPTGVNPQPTTVIGPKGRSGVKHVEVPDPKPPSTTGRGKVIKRPARKIEKRT